MGDELAALEAAELTVHYEPPHQFDPDLVMQAACQLRARLAQAQGAKIFVRKRIPVGAGLGGGSSDAAATLRLLLRLWQQKLPDEELFHIALQLGSDVPFFLRPCPALVRGRGERLYPVPLQLPHSFVVLYPGFSISTAWAYAALQRSEELRPEPAIPWDTLLPRLATEPELFSQYFANEFEPVLFARYPVLRRLRDALRKAGAFYAAVTGSGSAVFGIFESADAASRAAHQWQGSTVRAFVCRMYTGEA
jgi:4-diphosphocytidyl-2-C-methyl-D-erythritol kinase